MKRIALAGIVLTVLIAVASTAVAQGGFELSWFRVGGGGGQSSGGDFSLTGSFGQPAAGTLTSESYAVQGGFEAVAAGAVAAPIATPTPTLTPLPTAVPTDTILTVESRTGVPDGTVQVPIRLERAGDISS